MSATAHAVDSSIMSNSIKYSIKKLIAKDCSHTSVDTKYYVATLTMSSVGNAFKFVINAIDALMT